LIIDSKEILITSANMTGRGMQRNLEMGIYHKGQPAKEAENLIKELIDDRYFNLV
jgi:phosphatidylserine/phosphatidylglycerophosphate/cardiolipin synthase-like enzyme